VRILVIQTAFPGDVLLTVPLLTALRQIPGAAAVCVVATPEGAAVLETQSASDRNIVFDKRGDAGSAEFTRAVRAARDFAPDVAVVPHRSFRSALLARLSGARRRIGFAVSGGRWLLTERVPYDTALHEIERVVSLARPLGWVSPPGRVPFVLDIPVDGMHEIDAALVECGVAPERPIVVASPGSRWATKRWPPEKFASALDALALKLDAAPVVTGTAADSAASAAVVAAASGDVVDLTGRFGAAGWIALIDRAELLLSNDSASLHVATGVGTPVVAVFGATVPEQGFGPYSDTGRVAEARLDCRPCGRHGAERCPLGTHRCMEDVGVEDVIALALGAYRQAEGGPEPS